LSGEDGAVGRPSRASVVSWCLFDFANSSYTTLIVTVVYSVYFRDVVVGAADNRGDRLWGIANFLAMAVVAVTSPILGAMADYSGRRKFFLILTTLQTVVATALLYFVGPGNVLAGILLYVVATIGFEGGYVFYNAFLPDVSTPKTIGRVSGWAWAVGYAGGLLSLAVCYPLIKRPLRAADGTLDALALGHTRLSFLLVAAFFLVFALPSFLWLRESKPAGRLTNLAGYVTGGFRRVRETVTHLRSYRETGKFILASLFFTDGITTVISFSAIYATTTFGFGRGDLVILFLVLNVVAFPGSLIAGHLADRFGPKRTIVLSLLVWVATILVGYGAQSKSAFFAMACLAALGMGSTQAVGRSFMAQITPPSRESEFFGFYVLSGKFGSIFGPLVFGLVSEATGSQRLAVLSLLPFFLAGLAIMLAVDEPRALAQAEGRS
jgi:MFS transporter, UMF1 family